MSAFTDRMYILEYQEQLRQAEKRRKEKEMNEKEKQIKEIERKKQQEKEQKEYEKDIYIACKKDLQARFEKDFELQGIKAKYNFYNIDTRNIIIKSIAQTEKEADFLETNYNKFLNEVIKKYELHEQYKEEQEKEIARQYVEEMTPKWKKEARTNKIKNIIFNILIFPFKHIIISILIITIGLIAYMFMDAFGFSFLPALGLSITITIILIGIILGFIK